MARGLKFLVQKVEGLYYPCSENKDTDQLRGQREADLRLCFRINNQRTNGPVDAHLLGLVKHKTWKIYGKEMTLTFNTHIPS